jgi:hypothetical protein
MKLFSKVFVWDLFNRSTSDKNFYSSWWIDIRSEFSDEDLLWSFLTDLLIDATVIAAETKVLLTIS